MELQLSKEDTLKAIYESLCNGGLTELYMCGVQIDYSENNDKMKNSYLSAKERLIQQGKEDICREDVWIEILNGEEDGFLPFYDSEGEEYFHLTLSKAKENLQKATDWTLTQLVDVINDTGCPDAWSYFNILQQALLGEVIYG